MRLRLLFTAAISIFILAGCGVRGKLKTPPPVWGDKDRPKSEQPAAETDTPDDFPELEDKGPKGPY